MPVPHSSSISCVTPSCDLRQLPIPPAVSISFPALPLAPSLSGFFRFNNHVFSRPRKPRPGVVMAAKTDYYSTLNVPRNANLDDIKRSYRNLARKYHPDMNKSPGAEDKFKEVSAANEVLSDDEKRSLYDRFGEAGLEGDFDGTGGSSQGVDPFDLYSAFFGGSDGIFGGMGEQGGMSFDFMNRGNQNLDIRYDLHLSFEDSIFGGKQDIEVPCFETCKVCSGSGAKSSSCLKTCRSCEGRGGVMRTRRTHFGVVTQVSTCAKCGGEGKVITDHCRSCGGHGRVHAKKSMKIVIPPGVSSGATMRVQGEGNFDKERGNTGDLFIILRVDGKQGIWREGLNLYSKINVDYTDAILGTMMEVETVEGTRDLQILPGTQPGDAVKLRRMGVPDTDKPYVRGDHHFIVNVFIPKDISENERALLKELSLLRRSSKAQQYAGDVSETFKGEVAKDGAGEQKDHASVPGFKPISSLWNKMKSFLRCRESQSRFASTSTATGPVVWRSSKPDIQVMVSVLGVFILTCVVTVIGRNGGSLRQRRLTRNCCEPKTES